MPNLLPDLLRDLRLTLRRFRREPFFPILSIGVLSIGLAFSAIMFALVDATLLSPLPYRDPSHLVALYESIPVGEQFHISYDDFHDWQRQNATFESLAIYRADRAKIQTPAGLQHVQIARVSDAFFQTLGVAPILGRAFKSGEELPGAAPAVILSHHAWQARFGMDPAIIGKVAILDGASFQIIGVLPPSFHFAPSASAEFWLNIHGFCGDANRRCHAFYGIGRLKNGVPIERGRADLQQIAQRIAAISPATNGDRGATVLPLADLLLGNFRPTLFALSIGATLLLVIAVLNVAGLLLVQAQRNRRDMAIRGALGASRSRQARQFAIDGILLAFLSFVLSIVIAASIVSPLASLIPSGLQDNLPSLRMLHPSWSMAAFSMVAAILSAALFAAVPLTALAGDAGTQALHEGGRYATGKNWRRFGARLMVGELAITVLLLVCAGLLARSYLNLQRVDLGILPQNLVAIPIEFPEQLNDARVAFSRQIRAAALSLPGVQSAGMSYAVATGRSDNYCHFRVPGRPYSGQGQEANLLTAGDGYFETVQATLIAGRFFAPDDRASGRPVAVINRTMATKFFSGENAIGKHVLCEWNPGVSMEIIGVVGDIQEQAIDAEPKNVAYASFEQGPDSSVYLTVRSSSPDASILPSLLGAVARAAPGVVVDQPERMQQKILDSPASYLHRAASWLTSAFAAVAALLACAGLYGIVSYSVAQRTREFAVRLAVGAPIHSIYKLVFSEGLMLVLWGAAFGITLSLLAASALRSMLFGVKPWDETTLLTVVAGLALVALMACVIPGIHASRVPPVEALKAD